MSESVNVGSFASTIDAEIARQTLEANGIHAAILADDAGGMLPPLTNEVRLMVLAEDADLARQILETSVPLAEDDGA